MVYFDTSFIAPLFLPEPDSARVEKLVRSLRAGSLAISHWTHVEFASLLGRRVRMKDLSERQAAQALALFEQVAADSYHVLLPAANDFDLAVRLLENRRAGLRSGDALHLAVAQNHDAEHFYTLDASLLKAAALYGISASSGK